MLDEKWSDENDHEDNLRELFDAELEAVIKEVYPVLHQRLRMSRFAGWHRDHNRLDDLAQQAACQFLSHCRRHNCLPKQPLNYMVTIAKNLAKRSYQEALSDPAEGAQPLSELRRADQVTDTASSPETYQGTENQKELLRAAIDNLPKRQREAFTLRLREPEATDKELGAQLGIREDAFRKNSTRAFERIKREIQELSGRELLSI